MDDILCNGKDLPEEETPLRTLHHPDARENVPLALLPEAGQAAYLPRFCSGFQLSDVPDAELAVQDDSFLRADPLEPGELGNPFGQLLPEFFEIRQVAGFNDLPDLCRDIRTDTWDLFQFPALIDPGDVLRQRLD